MRMKISVNLMVSVDQSLPAVYMTVRDGNSKISHQCFKGSLFDPFHHDQLWSLLPFKGKIKLLSRIHVVPFHVCYCEITHLIIKRMKIYSFDFGIEAQVM